MDHPVKTPKKLIEVALPLDAINAESALRKRKAPAGYPTTLHKWWAQRPVAVARAVVFAQMVNDPSWRWEMDHPGQPAPGHFKGGWAKRRKELFRIIDDLVKWDNTSNDVVLDRARSEIRKSWRETCEVNKHHPRAAELFDPDRMPVFHDPFAGSGTLPLEALRLGLDAYASDLNPVAVFINKATIEIPPKFRGMRPVSPATSLDLAGRNWEGVQGLAEDVRLYSQWMRDEAERRIGNLYPPIEITPDMAKGRPDLKPYVGRRLSVIAWLWARTVKSPNPAYSNIDVPLVATFWLSSSDGREAYIEPVIDSSTYRFAVRTGKPSNCEAAKNGTRNGSGSFRCLLSGAPISYEYIDGEANAGRMGQRLMAIVVDGDRGRLYLPPTLEQEAIASRAGEAWKPEVPSRGTWASNAQGRRYGFNTYGDYFTPRQLRALNTFSELIAEVIQRCEHDARAAGMVDDGVGLDSGGRGARAYAEAVATYLTCAISRLADYGSSLATWRPKDNAMRSSMPKQAIQMSWDFAEGSPFAKSSSGFLACAQVVARVIETALSTAGIGGSFQASAMGNEFPAAVANAVISTDPPYFDNISYADLSDFIYVWLRRTLRLTFPRLFSTVAVPKAEELVATPYRHGSKEQAEKFFLDGMTMAIRSLAERIHPAFPVTIYYAFKQTETTDSLGTSSSGWETFLQAVIGQGFAITGTWPMRTEGDNRQVGNEANALASSIVLVARQRAKDAPTIGRRSFARELSATLPQALDEITRGDGGASSRVAPVDLSQAIIGPGMAVYSKYSAVLEADGTPMTVRTALQLINRYLADDDFDQDTQFCLQWFQQYAWKDGNFGDANTLAQAKGTAVDGVAQSGVVYSAGGLVRLRKWADYPEDWNPTTDTRIPVWEVLHQLIRVFKTDGESGAGSLLGAIQTKAEAARQLAYRLYTLCERAGLAEDARAYNEIITSWTAIESAATAATESVSAAQSSFALE